MCVIEFCAGREKYTRHDVCFTKYAVQARQLALLRMIDAFLANINGSSLATYGIVSRSANACWSAIPVVAWSIACLSFGSIFAGITRL